MKDRLEEFVGSHRNEFDLYEPKDALWEGIEKNLDKQLFSNSSKRKQGIGYYMIRVAGIAAIFLISISVQRFFFDKGNAVPEIPELKEAELYYSGILNQKLDEAKPLLINYPDIKQDIDTDLSELDSVYNDLKKDLKDNVANEEVIGAMIENYRLRIDILEEMLNFLQEQNSDNTSNNSEYEL
ncbi:MAG: hypothetical protein JXA77_16885 [Bacteroidales bacterium]|nr:hypothetical protein [Bacteroidales bacterium]MBN2819377.1 hypothetical protein [Bacteroidales bacterium]